MKYTKFEIPLEKQIYILTFQTYEKFLQAQNFDALALYLFYYRCAKLQETNQIWATSSFCMKGLGWGKDRFKKAKDFLKEINLIEEVKVKSNNGRIKKHCIKLRYIFTDDVQKRLEIRQNLHPTENPPCGENGGKSAKISTPTDFPTGGSEPLVDDRPINALSSNNKNALSSNNKKLFVPTDKISVETDDDSFAPLTNNLNNKRSNLNAKDKYFRKVDEFFSNPDKDWYNQLLETFPDVDFEKLFQKMKLWLKSNYPTHIKKNFKRFAMNWINKSADKGQLPKKPKKKEPINTKPSKTPAEIINEERIKRGLKPFEV